MEKIGKRTMEICGEKITLLRRDESGQQCYLGGYFIPGGGSFIPGGGQQCGLVGDFNSERTICIRRLLRSFKSSDLNFKSSDRSFKSLDLPVQLSDVYCDFFLRRHCFPIFTDCPKFRPECATFRPKFYTSSGSIYLRQSNKQLTDIA